MHLVVQLLAEQRNAELRQEAERQRRLRAARASQPGRRHYRWPGRWWPRFPRPRARVPRALKRYRAAGRIAGDVR